MPDDTYIKKFEETFDLYKFYIQKRTEINREKFCRLFHDSLIAYARRKIPPTQGVRTWSATDLVYDTFLTIDTNSLIEQKFSSAEDMRKYAMRLITNHYIDYCRKRISRIQNSDSTPIEMLQTEDPTAKQELLCIELVLQVEAEIEKLRQVNPPGAEIVENYFYLGHDNKEIAKLLNISTKSASEAIRLFRLSQNLKNISDSPSRRIKTSK